MIVVLELVNNNEGLTQYGFLFLSFVFPDQLKPHSVSGEGGGEGGEEGEVVLVGWGGRQGEGEGGWMSQAQVQESLFLTIQEVWLEVCLYQVWPAMQACLEWNVAMYYQVSLEHRHVGMNHSLFSGPPPTDSPPVVLPWLPPHPGGVVN